VKREFQAQGGYFMSKAEIDAVGRVLVTPQRLPNPALVGKAATAIADKCGITVPADTRVLIAPLDGVGRDYPLSIEKLCPVLSFYVVKDWREGCERCRQILRYGGMGHTMSIHSQNDAVILEFGLKKPAFRIVVNTPTTHGSIGLTTGLDPAMTLGCGGYGGNITSDNISPRHLLNIKRLAYEIHPAANRFERAAGGTAASRGTETALPGVPVRRPPSTGINADVLTQRIDQFLGSRGYRGVATDGGSKIVPAASAPVVTSATLDFVCEDDVRLAIQAGRTLVLSERAIVTPAARDLGEQHRVFTVAPWRG
jgi:acetaldehyde dehydrogenase (acetylating)